MISPSCNMEGGALRLECSSESHAVFSVESPLSAPVMRQIHALAELLPRSVRVLQVHLRASEADAYTMYALREIIRVWKPRGTVHLLFAGEPSADRDVCMTKQYRPALEADWSTASQTAAFL